jgi:hypothetical protein
MTLQPVRFVLLALLSGCAKSPALDIATQPQCTDVTTALALVQCWSPIRQLVEQCEIVNEAPAGCGFAEQALEFSRTVTLSPSRANGVETATWVMFEVMRDEHGRVGRPGTRSDGTRYLSPPAKPLDARGVATEG